MKKFLLFVAISVISATSSHAGLLSSALTINGTTDALSTSTPGGAARLVDSNGDLVTDRGAQAGDILYGFVVSNTGSNDINTGFESGLSFDNVSDFAVGVFAGEVVDTTTSGQFLLKLPDTDSFRLENLLGSGLSSQLDGSGAVIAALTSSIGIQTPRLNALDLGYFDDADFTLEFAGDLSNDGFFQLEETATLPLGPNQPIAQQVGSFDVIAGIGEMGNLNFKDIGFSSIPLLPPLFPLDFGAETPIATSGQIIFDFTVVRTSSLSSAPGDNGWQFVPQSSAIYANIVPEPGSLSIA